VTLPVIFHEHAESELNEASTYYARARPGLGDAFVTEVQHAVDALATSPFAGTAVEKDVRWWLLRRFPYSVLYRVCDDHLRILAIAHQKRRPFYWRGRQ
jgi:plasmid stabilization system protein ParE